MKNALTQPKKQKFVPIEDIMKNPASKAKLLALVDEAVNCKQKMDFEKESIKGLREAAMTDIGVHPKLFNAYVSMAYNNNYGQVKEQLEQQLSLVDAVMGNPDLEYDGE